MSPHAVDGPQAAPARRVRSAKSGERPRTTPAPRASVSRVLHSRMPSPAPGATLHGGAILWRFARPGPATHRQAREEHRPPKDLPKLPAETQAKIAQLVHAAILGRAPVVIEAELVEAPQ